MSVKSDVSEGILKMVVHGKLTDADYVDTESGILSMIQKYGEEVDHLKIMANVADFEGWESGAEKEEWALLSELKHKDCDFAIVGAHGTIKSMLHFFAKFIHHPKCQAFDTEEEAITWLNS